MLQPFGSHLGSHVAEDHGGHLAVDALHLSDGCQSLDPHRVSHADGGLLCCRRSNLLPPYSFLHTRSLLPRSLLLRLALLPALLTLL